MTEKMNVGAEKMFFNHILLNPMQFEKVEPYFFKNDDIQFIYTVVRQEYLISKNKVVPTPQQILAMVKLADVEKKIADNLIKVLLKGDNTEYEKDWLELRFKAWKLSNSTKNNVMKSIDYIRGLEDINYDNVVDVANKIKNLFGDLSTIDNDDDDLGHDFDDPESHKVNDTTKKQQTGWLTMDKIMGGGWDLSTLVVMVGQTSVGKSLWMQNIAVKAADQGLNVAFITLEMGSQKCMKRMGAMRLKIPVDDYDTMSKDTVLMKNKLNALKNANGGMFNFTPGKIFVKKYNTSSCTKTDIDNYVTKLEESKKIKIHMVVVDYINLMGLEKGLDFNNMLFLKGKHFAEGLRYVADKHQCMVLTATQTSKDVWDANDLNLKDMPESKAIAETADTVWGIIRNPEMMKHNKYRLKILKLRDGEHKNEQIKFDFNTKFMLLENDELVGTV